MFDTHREMKMRRISGYIHCRRASLSLESTFYVQNITRWNKVSFHNRCTHDFSGYIQCYSGTTDKQHVSLQGVKSHTEIEFECLPSHSLVFISNVNSNFSQLRNLWRFYQLMFLKENTKHREIETGNVTKIGFKTSIKSTFIYGPFVEKALNVG